MEELLQGYRHFRETYWEEHKSLFQTLAAKGQSPRALVVACCDSRVSPEVIFSTEPGGIFVVRNVANLVPPYAPDADNHGTSAALEFAVRKLQVEHVIILGHSRCGGIHALLHGADDELKDFIAPWMEIAKQARFRAVAASHGDLEVARPICEQESIRISLDNLLTFPWIMERVAAGTLQLHGFHFDVDNGTLERIRP